MPCRQTLPGRRIRTTAAMMSGIRYCPAMFGWPAVCETMAGAKPRKAPATAAAGRERPRWRLSAQYQAAPVPARASVVMIANVTPGPSQSVTGVSGSASVSTDVFAMRLTPSGELMSSEKNGDSPSVKTFVACVRNHSKVKLSWKFSAR
jgi:hypothetical protein